MCMSLLMSINVLAAQTNLREFNYQNRNHFNQNITAGIQTMLYYYNSTSRTKLGNPAIDGSFGPNTEASLKEFQRAKGIAQDGVISLCQVSID